MFTHEYALQIENIFLKYDGMLYHYLIRKISNINGTQLVLYFLDSFVVVI